MILFININVVFWLVGRDRDRSFLTVSSRYLTVLGPLFDKEWSGTNYQRNERSNLSFLDLDIN